MIHAYDEEYLDDAMTSLGEAFDYAVYCCKLTLDEFMDLFVGSDLARQFEIGVPRVVSGISGTELVMEVIRDSFPEFHFPEPRIEYDYSCEYWCGWILAYYQWHSAQSFMEIRRHITMQELERLYSTLHEANEDKFIDVMTARIENEKAPCKLQIQRKYAGLSQKELAEKSGVNLRTLQQYELKSKDINKAAVDTVVALSRALGCEINDILEYD